MMGGLPRPPGLASAPHVSHRNRGRRSCGRYFARPRRCRAMALGRATGLVDERGRATLRGDHVRPFHLAGLDGGPDLLDGRTGLSRAVRRGGHGLKGGRQLSAHPPTMTQGYDTREGERVTTELTVLPPAHPHMIVYPTGRVLVTTARVSDLAEFIRVVIGADDPAAVRQLKLKDGMCGWIDDHAAAKPELLNDPARSLLVILSIPFLVPIVAGLFVVTGMREDIPVGLSDEQLNGLAVEAKRLGLELVL